MGFLQNTWVRYFDRTYQQIKDGVLTRQQSRVPEITDHTESETLIKALDIWSGIAEMLGYYVDNAGRESFIDSCRLYRSAIAIAKRMDYRVRSRIPASADLVFTLSGTAITDVTIPIGTVVEDADGVKFETVQTVIIPAGNLQVTVSARQVELVINYSLGISNGAADQIFLLPANVADNSAVVRVNSLTWNPKQTLGYSIFNSEDFVFTVNKDKVPYIRFGNGMNGKIPPVGEAIDCDYYTTLGEGGNVSSGTLTTITSGLFIPGGLTISVTNPERASGGGEVETLLQLKRHIPISFRTLERAVTEEDYVDVAELAPGVALADVYFNCGKTVDIYIVPDGGGIASSILTGTTQTWMDFRKMITTFVRVFPAGEVRLKIRIKLRVKSNYSNAVVSQAVTDRLTAFLSYLNQEIGGSIYLSDIYEIIETTPGVQNSEVEGITPLPYARPLNLSVPILNWVRQVQITSAGTHKYNIKMVSGTSYQLMVDNNFIGTFNVGDTYTDANIVFQITSGSYSTNDEWEFTTYPYNNVNLNLAEPSLPVALNSDITITATGGV